MSRVKLKCNSQNMHAMIIEIEIGISIFRGIIINLYREWTTDECMNCNSAHFHIFCRPQIWINRCYLWCFQCYCSHWNVNSFPLNFPSPGQCFRSFWFLIPYSCTDIRSWTVINYLANAFGKRLSRMEITFSMKCKHLKLQLCQKWRLGNRKWNKQIKVKHIVGKGFVSIEM